MRRNFSIYKGEIYVKLRPSFKKINKKGKHESQAFIPVMYCKLNCIAAVFCILSQCDFDFGESSSGRTSERLWFWKVEQNTEPNTETNRRFDEWLDFHIEELMACDLLVTLHLPRVAMKNVPPDVFARSFLAGSVILEEKKKRTSCGDIFPSYSTGACYRLYGEKTTVKPNLFFTV